MVEAPGSHFRLLLTSILGIYKEFEHIDMLSIGIQQQLSYKVYPPYLAQILQFCVTRGVKMMSNVLVEAEDHLKLLPMLSILDMFKMFEHIDMLSIGIF